MTKVVAVHSFRGRTGKSTITANLITAIAASGRRIAGIETDIQSPGIHVLFGLEQDSLKHTLNSYLRGDCAIAEAACDVSPEADKPANGGLFLLPSDSAAEAITQILHEGQDLHNHPLPHGIKTVAQAVMA